MESAVTTLHLFSSLLHYVQRRREEDVTVQVTPPEYLRSIIHMYIHVHIPPTRNNAFYLYNDLVISRIANIVS